MPYKRGSRWIGQVVQTLPDGRKRNLSHRSATKREAIECEEAKRREIQQGGPCKTRTVSLHEWATAYLDFAKNRFVQKTYEEKRLAFRELFSDGTIAPSEPASSLSGKDVLAFLQRKASESGNAANNRRKNLRAAFEWGKVFLDLPGKNPFDAAPRFAEVRDDRVVPEIGDFWKVLEAAKGSQTDHTMLLFALHTGARRDEMFRLPWRDVDLAGKSVILRWRKNQAGEWREQRLPLSDDLVEALRRQRQVTGLLGNVFMWQTHDRQWLPYQYRQHWLKKLCKRAGVDIVTIAEILGNTVEQCSAAYLHVSNDRRKTALEKL